MVKNGKESEVVFFCEDCGSTVSSTAISCFKCGSQKIKRHDMSLATNTIEFLPGENHPDEPWSPYIF